jgi:DNA replicative helicase MCM subunit Mcm2 (Cdc46/Mcm family)
MYAVVGCPECSSLWVVEGRPETSQCPTCRQTRAHEKRKQFVTTEDPDHAREVRASMLAARQGHDDAFAELDSFAQLEEQIDDAGINDETYLEASGVDIDEVDEAADRATEGAGTGGQSRREVVLDALREREDPDETEVVEYAEERGVSPEYARRALEKLVRAGEVSESGGRYRLL